MSFELKANAHSAELRQQRDFAFNRCASLAADLTVALAENETLKARVAELEKAPAVQE